MSRHGVVFLMAMLAGGVTARAADAVDVSWEKLKSLVGEWQEQPGDGMRATLSYRIVSSGTAITETLESDHDDQMITIYHLDGMALLMTHYCSLGNQTRMRSRGLEGGRLAFAYVDASNVKSAGEHVMSGLVMSFPAPGRLVHEWTSKAGSEERTKRFEFVTRE